MKKGTLRIKILNVLIENGGWMPKGDICDIIKGHLEESVGRRLREMARNKEIMVGYYKSKNNRNLAKYAIIGTQKYDIPLIKSSSYRLVNKEGRLVAIKMITNNNT